MYWNPAVGIPLLLLSVIIFAALYFYARPQRTMAKKHRSKTDSNSRIEPDLYREDDPHRPDSGLSAGQGSTPGMAVSQQGDSTGPEVVLGQRPDDHPIERIVTLFVAAREERSFLGSDLVVAAEKVGLEYGDMEIFHRLDEAHPQAGPMFSVANMVKPGNFDFSDLDHFSTPGLGFFMTLPGPLPALDAWEIMLPASQRMAELLDGVVLDAERNALGRQGIAYIRDQLRGWDRSRTGTEIHLDSHG